MEQVRWQDNSDKHKEYMGVFCDVLHVYELISFILSQRHAFISEKGTSGHHSVRTSAKLFYVQTMTIIA